MTPNLASQAQDIRAVAHDLADAARSETLRYFRADGLTAENKEADGFDPVTAGDRSAEQAMRAILAERRPDDAILGEESGSKDGTSGLTWVLDPIDGTRGFISGTPTWGVLISVSDETGPVYGIIDQPYIGERFEGGFDVSRCVGPMGDRASRALGPRDLSDAIVLTTFPKVGDDTEQAAFHDVAARAKLTRYGMDCYGYALVAGGHVDLVIEAGLQAYDICAPIAVVQAAGGIVTDWSGGPAHAGGRAIAAANAEIHAQALAILQGHVDD